MADELSPPEKPTTNGDEMLPHDKWSQLRQISAGLIAIGIACVDRWHFDKPEQGFSNNIDELLLLIGLSILAGVAGLFRLPGPPPERPK